MRHKHRVRRTAADEISLARGSLAALTFPGGVGERSVSVSFS